jgi:voltage-gated potassium channel
MASAMTDAPDPTDEPTRRQRVAEVLEDRLDIPMAFLAVVWAALVAYELVAPEGLRDELTVVGNVIWGIFVVEFVIKLVVSGRPVRFLRRRWPALLFLLLPILRVLRIVRALRVLRVLPAARVMGSSYRAIGTAQSLLGNRVSVLAVASLVVVFSGGQLIFVLEEDTAGSLSEALWWSANAGITGNLVFEPTTVPGRLVAVALSAFAVVVFASMAATIGAYFIESRTERALAEEGVSGDAAAGGDATPAVRGGTPSGLRS